MRIEREGMGLMIVSSVVVPLVLIGCGGSGPLGFGKPEISFDDAVILVDQGETDAAVDILDEIVSTRASEREGYRAALFLGSLHVRLKRYQQAIPPLEVAASGTEGAPYANLLLIRAIVDGGISDRYEDASARAVALLEPSEWQSPLLRRDAALLLCRLNTTQSRWQETIVYGQQFLEHWGEEKEADEVRWLVASALREAGRADEAFEAYEGIWYDSPTSPWATEARDQLNQLKRAGSFRGRQLSAGERYEFAKALRAAGLHEDAIFEIDEYLRGYSGHSQTDGALFMKAMSLHSLRKNNDCVQTVEKLRRSYPRSQWLPAASIYAVKALRRSDNTPQVTRWCDRVVSDYPGHPKAYEALYNLGVYLGNVEGEAQGLEVLRRLVREAPTHGNADDAMWKIAWMERRRGNTDAAIDALDTLLREQPDSGYRKAVLYWLGRFRQEGGRRGAEGYFQTLLEEFPNDYYGHQALENLLADGIKPQRIGNGRRLPPIDFLDDPQRYQGEGAEAYQRACYLAGLGLYDFAADELMLVPASEHDQSFQFALARLSSRAGETWETARILDQHFKEFMIAGSRDASLVPIQFWRTCYPYNHREIVREAIDEAGLAGSQIDEYLVAALIRMESRFLSTAISPVGAIGLMQLMPDTAVNIAGERGLALPTREELFRPETNIRYGTYFLAQRVNDFGGDWFPAICSYNAGVNPVRGWWGERSVSQLQDEFIENIPYLATRLYIKQILGDYKNYEWIYP